MKQPITKPVLILILLICIAVITFALFNNAPLQGNQQAALPRSVRPTNPPTSATDTLMPPTLTTAHSPTQALQTTIKTPSLPTSKIPTASYIPTSTPIYQHKLGIIAFDPDNGTMETFRSGVDTKNLRVRALFYVPHDAQVKSWSYGFIFRDKGDEQYQAYITSDARWKVRKVSIKDGKPSIKILVEGTIKPHIPFSTVKDYKHTLSLKVHDGTGEFYLDDYTLHYFKLDNAPESGDILIATGLEGDDELDGGLLRFENLRIIGSYY